MITLTEKAKEYLYKIAKKNNKNVISFGVNGGGCAGFSYKWDYLDSYDDTFTILPIQDNVVLAVDKVAEMYIMGSTIDYVQELMGSFLKIDNPLTKSSCGCGESFSV
jgi:iron-sulfur cluster assembly accessory protein|tara:strand:+ start:187 stop:507 length:321 start_codon:yes stop_codon:yes gene_type:complete